MPGKLSDAKNPYMENFDPDKEMRKFTTRMRTAYKVVPKRLFSYGGIHECYPR